MWQAHRFWVVRVALVLIVTAMAEALVVWLLLESHPRRSRA
jgi:hypothetical protein